MRVKKSNIQIVKDYLAGERPFIQVGYTKTAPERKEGEQWVDGKGVKWEQRDGWKTRVNEQANLIRSMSQRKCACGQDIRYAGKLDEKFFRRTSKCFDCVIKEETELRVLGVYPQYEKYKMISNYLGFLVDLRSKIKDSIKYFEGETGAMQMLCNGEGFLEKFTGVNHEELLKNAKADFKAISKTIRIVAKDKNKEKKKYETELKVARDTAALLFKKK